MIFYKDDDLMIRSMKDVDAKIIYNEFLKQNWHPSLDTYKNYYLAQENHLRFIYVAEYNGKIAGYTTMLKEASSGPFANRGIPEIVDFNVFADYRRRGIGNKILETAEKTAAEISGRVSLAVGLHSGYGAAQRIYVKRGYIPDGSGVWYQNKQLEQYADCKNNDDLVLYFSKALKSSAGPAGK
jgi:GNAT superfamily N-acetyltransferase